MGPPAHATSAPMTHLLCSALALRALPLQSASHSNAGPELYLLPMWSCLQHAYTCCCVRFWRESSPATGWYRKAGPSAHPAVLASGYRCCNRCTSVGLGWLPPKWSQTALLPPSSSRTWNPSTHRPLMLVRTLCALSSRIFLPHFRQFYDYCRLQMISAQKERWS